MLARRARATIRLLQVIGPAGDPLYEKLTPDGIAYQAARALVFEGVTQPSGYTEPLLHKYRLEKKAAA